MPIDSAKVATLSFNGTDTYFQPTGYIPTYPLNAPDVVKVNRSETISFVAACIDRKAPTSDIDCVTLFQTCPALKTVTTSIQIPSNPPVELEHPLNSRIIEGPDTLGKLVYKKIAEGTASLLGSIFEGRTTLNIQAHSRGSIQAILVAHELERIKILLQSSEIEEIPSKELLKKICHSPDSNISNELWNSLRPLESSHEALNRLKAIFRENDIRVNLCLLDPVPGNSVLRLPGIGWYDERYFKLPPIVNQAKITICENEDSACFDCVIPQAMDSGVTHVNVQKILGHHGTLTGNPFGNIGESLESLGVTHGTAEHAQIIALYETYDFLSANGTPFMSMEHNYPLKEIYNTYHQALPRQRKALLLTAYNQMKENEHVYKAMNRSVYITIVGRAFHEAFTYPYEKTEKTRPVLQDIRNTKSSLEVILPFKSDRFVNEAHIQLFLELTVGLTLDGNTRRFEQMLHLISNLKSDTHAIGLEDGLNDPNIRAKVEDGIQNLASELVQLYLQNNLSTEEKSGTLQAINEALSVAHEPFIEQNGLSALSAIRLNLKTKLNEHLIEQIERQIQAHYNDLSTLVLAMRASPIEGGQVTAFFANAVAKYQQFTSFRFHLIELDRNIAPDPKLTPLLPEKIARLQIYCDATAFFCAKTMHEKRLSMRDIQPSQDWSEFVTYTKSILDGLSGVAFEQTLIQQQTIETQTQLIARYVERTTTQQQTIDDQAQLITRYVDRATTQQTTMAAAIRETQLFGLNGISLQIVSGFIAILGTAAVALAYTAFAIGLLGAFPMVAGVTGGVALMSFGMFGVGKGSVQTLQETNRMMPLAM